MKYKNLASLKSSSAVVRKKLQVALYIARKRRRARASV